MPSFSHDGVTLCYEQYGARANPPVLLIHGLSCQLIHWPQALIQRLTEAGYRVIVFDNRDTGLSSVLHQHAVGAPEDVLADPRRVEPPYGLPDMARDAMAVLDYLGQSGAHLIGVSLGGMIAQQMALDAPDRVFSLTSIMSSTSDRDLPGGERRVFAAFASTPPAERQAAIDHIAAAWKLLGGPYHDSTREGLGRLASAAYDRGHHPGGIARQLLAILHAAPRGDALRELRLPALVVHGAVDPMVPLAAGERTADCLHGAKLTVYEHMGHDLPDPLVPDLAQEIIDHLDAAPERR